MMIIVLSSLVHVMREEEALTKCSIKGLVDGDVMEPAKNRLSSDQSVMQTNGKGFLCVFYRLRTRINNMINPLLFEIINCATRSHF